MDEKLSILGATEHICLGYKSTSDTLEYLKKLCLWLETESTAKGQLSPYTFVSSADFDVERYLAEAACPFSATTKTIQCLEWITDVAVNVIALNHLETVQETPILQQTKFNTQTLSMDQLFSNDNVTDVRMRHFLKELTSLLKVPEFEDVNMTLNTCAVKLQELSCNAREGLTSRELMHPAGFHEYSISDLMNFSDSINDEEDHLFQLTKIMRLIYISDMKLFQHQVNEVLASLQNRLSERGRNEIDTL